MDKKLADILWTARWGIKNNKPDLAYDEVTKALVYIGAEQGAPEVEPDRPNNPMPEGYLKGIVEPEFIVVKGVRFKDRGAYKTSSGRFEGLVVHYTVSGRTASSARAVVSWLAQQGYGCMVMDEDGKIYIPEGFDVFRSWGYHAGVSKWKGRSSVSDAYAGMEICCWGKGSKVGPFRETKGESNMIAGKYQTYTEAQEKALTNFILWARSKNPEFDLQKVAGHDELRAEAGKKGDKQDPGASLSMTMPAYRAFLVAQEKAVKAGKVPDPATPAPSPSPVRIALSWEDGDPSRASWSDALTSAIRRDLAVYAGAKDIERIVPKFKSLTDDQKVKALGEFYVGMAYYESGFNPKSQAVDVGTQSNRDSWSIGLYQLSVRDWQNKDSGGPKFTFDQLLEGVNNIILANRTMVLQIQKTGLIILPNTSKSRYWAVILDGNKYQKVDAILARVRKNAAFSA